MEASTVQREGAKHTSANSGECQANLFCMSRGSARRTSFTSMLPVGFHTGIVEAFRRHAREPWQEEDQNVCCALCSLLLKSGAVRI